MYSQHNLKKKKRNNNHNNNKNHTLTKNQKGKQNSQRGCWRICERLGSQLDIVGK
jgi:hypothetical protein